MTEDFILRKKDVERATGLSERQIRRLEADGAFPRRISLSARAVGWKASAVQAWMDGLAPVGEGS